MPNGKGCVFAVVVDGSGVGKSALQFADYIHNFAVKTDPAHQWQYEFTTQDGFGIYAAEPGSVRTGNAADPVLRKVVGSAFYFTLYGATPGTYDVSVATD